MPRRPVFYLGLALLALLTAFFLWRSRGGTTTPSPQALKAALERDPFDNEARLELAELEYRMGLELLKAPAWSGDMSEEAAIASWREELSTWRAFGEDVSDLKEAAEASPRAFARLYPARRRAFGRALLRRAVMRYRQAEALGDRLAPRAMYQVGNAYMNLGEGSYPFAEEYLLRMVEAGVESPHAYTFLGNLAYLSGETATALDWYRRAVELAPEDPVIAFNIGLAYAENDRPRTAIPFLTAAIERLENRQELSGEETRLLAQASLALGVAAFRAREYETAIRSLEALLELAPDNLEARYWLGLSYAAAGRLEAARAALQAVVEKDPNYRGGDARARLRALK